MKEIELKFRVSNFDETFKALKRNFQYISSGHELTEMYDLDSMLNKKDGRLRVRSIRYLNNKNNGEEVEFSYKRPLTRKGIKIELEHEVTVSKKNELSSILKEIGFRVVSSYERYRHTFHHKKVKITLDHFPFADFLELEGPKKEIISLAERLNFDIAQNITDSCDTIDDIERRTAGLSPRDHILFVNILKTDNEQTKLCSS